MLPDIATIKAKMKATWMDGDYDKFSRYMEPGAVEILAGWNIAPGERLLDVACGSGQIAIPAARAGLRVTGVDIATNLIESARTRAGAQGLSAQFDEEDAEQLPYGDGSFDVVVSLVGVMFAPRPEKVASELGRVCSPGGRLFLANWTPSGMAGQMFKVVAKHVPPPVGLPPATLWGDEETVKSRLADHFTNMTLARKIYPLWRYPFSVPELVEYFRKFYGPVKRAFAALDDAGQQSLTQELEEVFSNYNQAQDGTTELKSEYLEVAAIRR